jgi:hypothetical protein
MVERDLIIVAHKNSTHFGGLYRCTGPSGYPKKKAKENDHDDYHEYRRPSLVPLVGCIEEAGAGYPDRGPSALGTKRKVRPTATDSRADASHIQVQGNARRDPDPTPVTQRH